MRNNVYIKTLFRQFGRSLVLAILLGVTAFTFALRTVEFVYIRERIFEIAEFFSTHGFISAPYALDDVGSGADILENSPYVEISDRRRGVEGFLQGMLNADIASQTDQIPPQYRLRLPYAFFYGELIDIIELGNDRLRLVFSVDDVLVGYPEHVVAGQEGLFVEWVCESTIPKMEIGQRYFLKGIYLADFHLDTLPIAGSSSDVLRMRPFNEEGLWYIPVPVGEDVDFTMLGLERILEEVEKLRYNHSAVRLQTTMDMTSIPMMLENQGMGYLVEGRFINKNDYLNKNAVAVIHHTFAKVRDLSIGDTIVVNIPQFHYVKRAINMSVTGGGVILNFYDAYIKSDFQDSSMHELELEIVGIYNLFYSVDKPEGWIHGTALSVYTFIPDSILPRDIIITPPEWADESRDIYLPSTWYSFKLTSSQHEAAFMAENRDQLEAMGFALNIIDTNAQNFWESAPIILQSILFNAIVFWIVLLLVLLLVTFLFLRQRRKEFAVLQVLGCPINRSVRQILTASSLFLIPITIGSVLAWVFSERIIVNTLQTFEEMNAGYVAVFTLSPIWLISLIAIVFVIAILMVSIGAIRITRRPVLAILQETQSKKR